MTSEHKLLTKTQGFSLLEVLITLLVASVGLLGMVALQTNSVRYTQDIVHQNNAILLTNELVSIMRSQQSELAENDITSSIPMFRGINSNSAFLGEYASDVACVNNPQTAEDMRDCWVNKVVNILPSANVQVARSAANVDCNDEDNEELCNLNDLSSTLRIRIAWQQPCRAVDQSDQAVCESTVVRRVTL